MTRVQWIGVVGLLVVAMGAGAWFGGRPPAPPPVAITDVTGAPQPGSITVHVAGAVRRPGLVQVPAGGRVADAVAAAGGAAAEADLDRLNLAAPLADGQQVVVPRSDTSGTGPSTPADGRVRLNQASASELQSLPGIGPVLAAQIVAHRSQHGPFGSVEDLLDVPGIGESKLAALRDAVVVP